MSIGRIFSRLALFALFVGLLVAGAIFGHLRGWWADSRSPEELSRMLRPHDRIFLPDGRGPFPTLIFIHGCGGLSQARLDSAKRASDWGYALVAVDSLVARDFAPGRNLCGGRAALGPERAGDVWVSLSDIRRMDFVDPERIALVGYSHGGWTLMELLAFDPPHARPATLRSDPQGGLEGVRSMVLYYPYCGFANLGKRWSAAIPTLFLLGSADQTALPEPCIEAANVLQSDGLPVRLEVYEGAGHGFDVPPRSGRTRNPPFDPEIAARSENHFREFLELTLR